MSELSRRGFLAGAATGIAAVCTKPLSAIEPIQRTGKRIEKLSLAAYSMRQYLTAKPGTKDAIDLFGFVDYCASLGIEGTELTSYYFPEKVTADYLNELKLRTHLAGLSISGGAIRNNYCQPPGEMLDADLAHTKLWIDHYADLGAPVIRVFAGSVPRGDSESETIKRCIATLEKACDLAGKRGVMLALENHGGITARAETMLEVVRGVKSPWFGVNFDSGNFRDMSDPYVELAKIAPYAVNAQVKVEVYRNKKIEPADLSRTVGVLRDAGYSGWIVLEYERKDLDPYQGVPRAVDELRGILHG
jgi:sugar phosphate isomerase/epimerase